MYSRLRGSVRWIAIVAILALAMVACGESAEETTTTAAATATTTTAAPTTTEAPTTTQVDQEGVFFVTMEIDPNAAWADGVPVTADDFIFTWETIINPDNDLTSREGFNKMVSGVALDDKTVRFGYSEVYAPWQNQWTQSIFPKHELEGKDFNTYWNDEITLGTGPFVFDTWTKDQNIKLVKNDNYWRSSGDVQEVIIPFIEESQTQVAALRGREIDMFYPQPQLSLVEQVAELPGVSYEVGAGPVWEHFDYNGDNPLLAEVWMRQAVSMGIDRESIVDAIIRPMRAEAEVLQNVIWMTGTVYYEDHFSQWDYNPEAAVALLEGNGCTKGSDGIYECNGERASFKWATTAGNEARELQFEIAQATLKDIGIEVNAAFGPASEVFSDEAFYGGSDFWDIFNFAWVGSPDPAGGNTIYYCEGEAPSGFGDLNNLRYCNEEVDTLIRSTDTIADPAERAAVYNQADTIIAADAAQLPLYQKPTFFAWYDDISGPKDNATQIGPFWNIQDWSGRDTLIFGADQQPLIMNNSLPDGNLFANGLIAEAILEGAFTVTPQFEYVYDLIVNAEVSVSG
jgi:peptide/nickel transport system substrate-binding protein